MRPTLTKLSLAGSLRLRDAAAAHLPSSLTALGVSGMPLLTDEFTGVPSEVKGSLVPWSTLYEWVRLEVPRARCA